MAVLSEAKKKIMAYKLAQSVTTPVQPKKPLTTIPKEKGDAVQSGPTPVKKPALAVPDTATVPVKTEPTEPIPPKTEVKDELQDIVKREELPERPPDKAEKLVVDKLRYEANDDIRNILGSSVTKRLLNIFNPLYVQVTFTKKPERHHLKAFLLKYKCAKFQRVDVEAKTFRALMRNIDSFCKICSVKTLRIDNIKAYIQPSYDYSKCPPKLKTIFSELSNIVNTKIRSRVSKDSETKESDSESQNNLASAANQSKDVKVKPNVNVKPEPLPNKPQPQINTVPKAPVVPKKEETPTPKTVAKTAVTATNTVTIAKAPVTNPVTKTTVTPNKTINIQKDVVKTTEPIQNLKTITKPQAAKAVGVVDSIKTVTTQIKKEPPVNKEGVQQKVTNTIKKVAQAQDLKTTPKPETAKTVNTTNTTQVNKQSQVNKDGAQQKVTNIVKELPKEAQSMNTVKTNTVTKKPTTLETPKKVVEKLVKDPKAGTSKVKDLKGNVKQKNISKTDAAKILEEGNDYDVLDDDDILALISGGVILDECSGSDSD